MGSPAPPQAPNPHKLLWSTALADVLNFLSPPTGNLWSEELQIFWDTWLRRHGQFKRHQASSPSLLETDFPGGGMRRLATVTFYRLKQSFPGGSAVKNLPANAADVRDMGSVPGLGRSPSVGNVNPLYSNCLGNTMDRGDWHAAVHGVAKSRTRPSTHASEQVEDKPFNLFLKKINLSRSFFPQRHGGL